MSSLRLLSISFLDEGLYVEGSDVSRRIRDYAAMVEEMHIVMLTTGYGREPKQIASNVWIHPTRSPHRLLHMFSAAKLAWSLMRTYRLNAISVQDPVRTGFVGYLVARAFGVPLLVSIYGTDIHNPAWKRESITNRISSRIGAFVLARADGIQTDGTELAADLAQRYRGKVFWKPVVPSDIGQFVEIKRDQGKLFRLLFVGRLVWQKNIPLLLDIITELERRAPDTCFITIVGSGKDRTYLEQELANRGIENVRYVPHASRTEMLELHRTNDALLLTSRYEGFARVFMEAAASGLPILTTKVSGVEGLVQEGKTGYVLRPDHHVFVNQILELAQDPMLVQMLSTAIRTYFKDHYRYELTLEIQEQIYAHLNRKNGLT